MKTLVSTLTISASLLLAACHGQNPFDRESDPTKGYPELNQAVPANKVPPAKPTPEPPPPQPAAEQNPCPKIFDIGFEENRGRLMKFEPGKSSQILLVARSYRQGQFKLELLDAPKGMKLSLAKDEGSAAGSLSHWIVEWTPGQELLDSKGMWESVVGLKYTNNNAKNARCGNHASEDFNILVLADSQTATNPIVSITELPQGRIQFGDHFNFKIAVSNTDSKSAPELEIGFNSDAFNTSTTLNAEKSVGCTDAKWVNSQWIYSCDFSSDKMADSQTLKSLIDQNKEVLGRFDVSAKTADKTSAKVRGLVHVFFPAPSLIPAKTKKE